MKDDKIPQGYKDSTLGIIPEDWEIKRLEDIADIDKQTLSSKTRKDYEFNYISLSDIDSDDFKIEMTKQKFSTAPSRARRIVSKGDILMATVRPNLQGFTIIREERKNLIASTGFAVISSTKCYNEYLFQFIFSESISKQFYQLLVGSNYPAINSNDVRKLKILYPPLPEQQKIAEILTCWDAAIEKQNQLIEKLELRKRGLIQKLLTGKGNRISAGVIFKSISVRGFDDEELLSATQDKGMIPRTMLEGRVTMPSTGTKGFKLVERGDFVISLRSFQGGLEHSSYRGLVSPAYTVLKPKMAISEEYYKQYFKSCDFIGHLAIAVIGIRDGKQVSYEDFCAVKIPFPPLEEQIAIADILLTAGDEIQKEKEKLSVLKHQKKGLMQQLLTGRKRVNL